MRPIKNKKAYFNYEILETIEAGLKLRGHEVKAIKSGKVSFEGSYITFRGHEAFWINGTISPYQPKNTPASYDPGRDRKLLLSRKEIDYLRGQADASGLTVIPLGIHAQKRGTLKMSIGLARHKKKWDKRETLKKKAHKKDIEQELRGKY